MFRLGINASRSRLNTPLIRNIRNLRVGRRLLNEPPTKVKVSSSPSPSPSLSQPIPNKRPGLKELTKKYGWAAVGVYFTISAIDLPVAFFIVHSMGKEKVQQIEKQVKGFFGFSTKTDDLATVPDGEGEGEVKSSDESSTWSLFLTEFTLAYAIHKSLFLFIRVPATAALTPWAVKKLQGLGFNIGRAAISSARTGASGAAKFGTAPSKNQKWWSWFF